MLINEDTVLEISDICYNYKNRLQTVKAVQGVSASFKLNTMYAVVGKSGSGKTTLMSLIAGLDLPHSGEIRYRGIATSALNCNDYRMSSVAVIYQDFNLLMKFTALENVMCPLLLKKKPLKEAAGTAASIMAQFGLGDDFHKRLPSMLSGGEQQRVAIARSLAANAEIIVADEPTGNLDSENGSHIIDILSSLAKDDGKCVIIVTHDSTITDRADVVYRMSDGKLVE